MRRKDKHHGMMKHGKKGGKERHDERRGKHRGLSIMRMKTDRVLVVRAAREATVGNHGNTDHRRQMGGRLLDPSYLRSAHHLLPFAKSPAPRRNGLVLPTKKAA